MGLLGRMFGVKRRYNREFKYGELYSIIRHAMGRRPMALAEIVRRTEVQSKKVSATLNYHDDQFMHVSHGQWKVRG